MGAAVGTAGRRPAGRRTAPAVGRTASHSPAPPAGRAQEIPNAQARAGIPCRAGAQAQRKPSTARAASPPPASRPQEIPNARAREDTTTRRPARNSKRARARYWRRGSRPLRVPKPKIFLGKGSKNRFRGTGAGKVGGVKNATEEENGAVLGKKEAAYAAACGESGGAVEAGGWWRDWQAAGYMERAGARVCVRGCGLHRGRQRWSIWRRVSFSWHHENGQRESGTTMPRREIEKRNCLQSVGSSAIILSVPNRQ